MILQQKQTQEKIIAQKEGQSVERMIEHRKKVKRKCRKVGYNVQSTHKKILEDVRTLFYRNRKFK